MSRSGKPSRPPARTRIPRILPGSPLSSVTPRRRREEDPYRDHPPGAGQDRPLGRHHPQRQVRPADGPRPRCRDDPRLGEVRRRIRHPQGRECAAVPIAMSDRKTLEANPGRIASLQVGPFSINDVECLILPEGYDTPPVLGASFLDQFASKVDFPAAQLTLVKVDVKPAHTTRAAP